MSAPTRPTRPPHARQQAGAQQAEAQQTGTQHAGTQHAGAQQTGTQHAGTQQTGTQQTGTQQTEAQQTEAQHAGTQRAPSSRDGQALGWAERAGDLTALLAAAASATGIAARLHARERLERALELADPGAVRAAERDEAARLGVKEAVLEATRVVGPAHAVRVPFVAADGTSDGPRALVRAVVVSYQPHEGATLTLAPDAQRAVVDAIALAAQDAPPPSGVAQLRLVALQPRALEGVPIDGPSLAAAAYVSALALFANRRVRPEVAITGALRGRALAPVAGIEAKREAAHARGLVLLAPEGSFEGGDGSIEGLATVDALAARALEEAPDDVSFEREAADARRLSARGWQGYRWPAIREQISRALVRVPERRPELRVELLTRLAAAERHLGRLEASARCVVEAEAIVRSRRGRVAVPDEPRIGLARQKAMTLLGALQLGPAERAARASVAIARTARLRAELIRSLGTLGLCALGAGHAEAAIDAFEEALVHTLEQQPQDAARSRAYLVEALGVAGRARRARREYELARDEAERDERRGVGGKVEWVRTSYATALVSLARWREVESVLDEPATALAMVESPLPGLRARRCLGLAKLRTSTPDDPRFASGLALLESSPDAYGALEPALARSAWVNVLVAQRERLAHGLAWTPSSETRVLDALARLPGVPAVVRARGELSTAAPRDRLRALDRLLAIRALLA